MGSECRTVVTYGNKRYTFNKESVSASLNVDVSIYYGSPAPDTI